MFKAMLLRLHEDGYMDADTVHEFLKVESRVLQKAIAYEPVSDSRAESDERTFEEILKCHKSKRG